MYITKTGSKTSAVGFDRNAAHPSNINRNPKYIGFRVYL